MVSHLSQFSSYMHFISQKLWAVCDLAMGLILSKTTNYEMKEFPAETRVPTMYFRRHEDSLWVNAKSYLPPDMQVRLFIDFFLIGYLKNRSVVFHFEAIFKTCSVYCYIPHLPYC
jgi:hypothetical protein